MQSFTINSLIVSSINNEIYLYIIWDFKRFSFYYFYITFKSKVLHLFCNSHRTIMSLCSETSERWLQNSSVLFLSFSTHQFWLELACRSLRPFKRRFQMVSTKKREIGKGLESKRVHSVDLPLALTHYSPGIKVNQDKKSNFIWSENWYSTFYCWQ